MNAMLAISECTSIIRYDTGFSSKEYRKEQRNEASIFALILLSCHFSVWVNNKEHALQIIKLAINAIDTGYFPNRGIYGITQTALGENPTVATIEIEKGLAENDAIAIEKTVFTLHRKNDV